VEVTDVPVGVVGQLDEHRVEVHDEELLKPLGVTERLGAQLLLPHLERVAEHRYEARVPLTDPELTGFMSTVPPRLKMKNFRKKHIMRQAMTGILPPEILNKKKVGLEMPYSKWFKGELNELMMDYLNPDMVAKTGLFRRDAVQPIIDDHMAGRRDNGRALWGLLNYMMWHDMYIAPSTFAPEQVSMPIPVRPAADEVEA
jgi:asparagine synthetase B (glutamine-hydrolysing)